MSISFFKHKIDMDFLENLFKDNPSSTLSIIVIIFFILIIITILLAFFYDYKKNKLNEKKITILERAIKDLIEEFRSFELLFQIKKKYYKIISIH